MRPTEQLRGPRSVRRYLYEPGVAPSPPEHEYPREAADGATRREAYRLGDGRWVVKWTFEPRGGRPAQMPVAGPEAAAAGRGD